MVSGGVNPFAPGDGASQAKHRLYSGSGRENLNAYQGTDKTNPAGVSPADIFDWQPEELLQG
jgi:hypothetical protein